MIDGAKALGVSIEAAFEVHGREAARALVLAGGGIGFVSRAEFSPDSRIVQIEIDDMDSRMSESIVYLSQRNDVRLIRAFMNIARELRPQG